MPTTIPRAVVCAVAFTATALLPPPAGAQAISNLGDVSLNAVVQQQLSVSAAPGLINYNLVPGSFADGNSAITVTTGWNVNPGLTSFVELWGYFDNPAAALSTGGGDTIATSAVLGSFNGGAFNAFNQTAPGAPALGVAGASLLLYSESISGANKTNTRVDSLMVRIDLTGSTNQATGTYTGTLHLQARAF